MKNNICTAWRVLGIGILASLIWTAGAQAQRRPAGGGGQRPAAKPANVQKPAAKPANVQKPSAATKQAPAQKNVANRDVSGNRSNTSGNRNVSGNKNVSGNNVNIDKSRGDVNINVDNSKDIRINNNRNTVVRANPYRPYTRPPYVYGGFHYRCYNPFFYHPYRPFYWGPVWHPWGFFVATLTATAIIVSFADADLPPVPGMQEYFVMQTEAALFGQDGMRSGPSMNLYPEAAKPETPAVADGEYYYDEGVFYLKEKEGYTVVAAPVGGIVKSIPSGYETIVLDDKSGAKNYYWGGTFYEKVSKGYKVVAPTSGSVVEHLAEGGEEVKMGEVTYVKLGETYYQPIQQNGKNMYEVVNVEEAK
jgi:hypothetical protein